MKESEKFFSPVIFLITALCFFLPFVSFTCQEQKIATISGMELVTGTKIEKFEMQNMNIQQSNPEYDKTHVIKSQPYAIAAFIIAVLGIIISFIPRYSKVFSVIAGALGALMLLFLRSGIGGEITGALDFKIIEISYEWGYYLALLLFIIAFALNLYLMISENKQVKGRIGDLVFHDEMICPGCGHSNRAGSLFCSGCGKSLSI